MSEVKSVEDLLLELTAKDDKILELEMKNEELQKTVSANEEKVLQLQMSNDGLTEANATLVKEVAAADNSKNESASAPVEFEREGQIYEILVRAANIPGIGKRTALEIATDEKAQAALVKSRSGLIRKKF